MKDFLFTPEQAAHARGRALGRRARPPDAGARPGAALEPAGARRADQRSRPRDPRSAAGDDRRLSRHRDPGQPRPRLPRPRRSSSVIVVGGRGALDRICRRLYRHGRPARARRSGPHRREGRPAGRQSADKPAAAAPAHANASSPSTSSTTSRRCRSAWTSSRPRSPRCRRSSPIPSSTPAIPPAFRRPCDALSSAAARAARGRGALAGAGDAARGAGGGVTGVAVERVATLAAPLSRLRERVKGVRACQDRTERVERPSSAPSPASGRVQPATRPFL